MKSPEIQAYRESVNRTIYTPGSTSGMPVNIMASFEVPEIPWNENEEVLREKISSTVTALLTLIGIKEIDPLRSREHILMANIIEHNWKEGSSLDLTDLIKQIQNPHDDWVMENVKKVMDFADTQLKEEGWMLGFDWVDKDEKNRIRNAKNGFMIWLDTLRENYPSGEEMVTKMAEFKIPLKEPDISFTERPVEVMQIPKESDPTYVTDDAKRDALPIGTKYYDAELGVERIRVAD